MTQILSGITAIVAFFAPAQVLGADTGMTNELTWIWRGLITASFALNVFFLARIYKKVQRIGPQQRAINTLHVAVDYLAREARDNGEKRQADHLIFKMLEDVDKLSSLEDET